MLCLPAGQQHVSTVLPGVVHRPQVQQISNNIVTLSNVQSPALYSSQPSQKEPKRPNSQTPQAGSLAAIGNSPKKGNFFCDIFISTDMQMNQVEGSFFFLYRSKCSQAGSPTKSN